jgi:hypothetical protein
LVPSLNGFTLWIFIISDLFSALNPDCSIRLNGRC